LICLLFKTLAEVRSWTKINLSLIAAARRIQHAELAAVYGKFMRGIVAAACQTGCDGAIVGTLCILFVLIGNRPQ
jgi:hypothetical protein